MKYLPAGTLTKARWRARAEGAAAATLVIAAIGAATLVIALIGALVAATPKEMYASPTPSKVPAKAEPYQHQRTQASPCTDWQAKDCVRPDDPTTTPYPIPEPDTLALSAAALVAAIYSSRRSK